MPPSKEDRPVTVYSLLDDWGKDFRGDVNLTDPVAFLKRCAGTGGSGHFKVTMSVILNALYVRRTKRYGIARPLLIHVYAHGGSPASFRLQNPGEALYDARMRMHWGGYIGENAAEICKAVDAEFRDTLADRIKRSPPFQVDLVDEIQDEDEGIVTPNEREQVVALQCLRQAQDDCEAARYVKKLADLRLVAKQLSIA